MKETIMQLDLFAQPATPAATMPTTASRPSVATIGSERPRVVTADLPCLVVDGIKNLTYYVQ